jgi:hypothetical protein
MQIEIQYDFDSGTERFPGVWYRYGTIYRSWVPYVTVRYKFKFEFGNADELPP